jgi:hypothetical protein
MRSGSLAQPWRLRGARKRPVCWKGGLAVLGSGKRETLFSRRGEETIDTKLCYNFSFHKFWFQL